MMRARSSSFSTIDQAHEIVKMLLFTVLLLTTSTLASASVIPAVRAPPRETLPPVFVSETHKEVGRHHSDAVNQRQSLVHPKEHQTKVHDVNFRRPVPAVHQPTFTRQNSVKQAIVDHNVVGHNQTVNTVSRKQESAEVPEGTPLILQQDMEVNPDGSFHNVWSSENGISVQEHGAVRRVGEVDVPVSTGEISYVDNEGRQYHLRYVADENGFRAEGDHLPTPPPLPAGIARGLEFIAAHPYVETNSHDSAHHKFQPEKAPVVVDN